MSGDDAYKIVQTNAARTWDDNMDFRALISSDADVRSFIQEEELTGLFDYNYYTRYVDELFERIAIPE